MTEQSPAGDPLDLEDVGREAFEPAAAGVALSGPLLEATLLRVRQRRRLRQGMGVLLAGLVFAAGVLCGRVTQHDARPVVGTPALTENPARSGPGIEAEMLAELSTPERRAELFRTAGDTYAASGGAELMGALRCYEQSLTGLKNRGLRDSGDEHWLRLALAEARDLEGGDR